MLKGSWIYPHHNLKQLIHLSIQNIGGFRNHNPQLLYPKRSGLRLCHYRNLPWLGFNKQIDKEVKIKIFQKREISVDLNQYILGCYVFFHKIRLNPLISTLISRSKNLKINTEIELKSPSTLYQCIS